MIDKSLLVCDGTSVVAASLIDATLVPGIAAYVLLSDSIPSTQGLLSAGSDRAYLHVTTPVSWVEAAPTCVANFRLISIAAGADPVTAVLTAAYGIHWSSGDFIAAGAGSAAGKHLFRVTLPPTRSFLANWLLYATFNTSGLSAGTVTAYISGSADDGHDFPMPNAI